MRRKTIDMTIRQKLCLIFLFTASVLFVVSITLSLQLNRAIRKVNNVYSSNISANDLAETLNTMESNVYDYLTTRSTESLENYYQSEQDYMSLVDQLNDTTSDNVILLQEKNIRNMSQYYVERADETISAKRGRNIEKYKNGYEECVKYYQYILEYINASNNQHFKQNASNYTVLLEDLERMEIISFTIMIAWAALSVVLLYLMAGEITGPLGQLALTANEVAGGDFDVEIPVSESSDEIGSLTKAFRSMVVSIREYIEQIKTNMEHEREMKEKELLMENHLKDAKLKYLQAQINPHFLFNSLNAGAQLALMEDAEKTCLFIEKMAEFFRYNVQQMKEDTTLFEELGAVDNYLYILNVRFTGDIHYEKKVDPDVPNVHIPSMILQPIVENAVNHGIQNIEREGEIYLSVTKIEDELQIIIRDNGIGMSHEKIDEILSGNVEQFTDSKSTGVGLHNVISRLELYYGKKGLTRIVSAGPDMGTSVIIRVPLELGGDKDV